MVQYTQRPHTENEKFRNLQANFSSNHLSLSDMALMSCLLLLVAFTSVVVALVPAGPRFGVARARVTSESHTALALEVFDGDVNRLKRFVGAASVAFGVIGGVVSMPKGAMAVSGGGKDFANKDLRDGDLKLEGGSFVGKDFTQVLADQVSFKGANLSGARFYKSNLNKADFSNCDLRTASLEDAGVDGAVFDNANLSGAYLSSSFEAVGSIKNVDFTDALLPKKTQANLCARADVNDMTKESLLCD